MNEASPPRNRGVQSVEISVGLLRALAHHRGPMTLSDLATAVGMAPAKVHRYLASFVETGMVEHRRSGTYDLGPQAAEIGVSAIARIDPVNRAADALPDLVEQTGLTALLAVWGNTGPTVVRWEKAATPLNTMLGLGSVLPSTRSATGQAFLAFLPKRLVNAAIDTEAPEGSPQSFADLLSEIRKTRLATADQNFIPGLTAIASPVFDLQNKPVAVVTLISTGRGILDPSHPARALLLAFASERKKDEAEVSRVGAV